MMSDSNLIALSQVEFLKDWLTHMSVHIMDSPRFGKLNLIGE